MLISKPRGEFTKQVSVYYVWSNSCLVPEWVSIDIKHATELLEVEHLGIQQPSHSQLMTVSCWNTTTSRCLWRPATSITAKTGISNPV